MPIGAIIGAVAAVAGIASSLAGQKKQQSAARGQAALNARQAQAQAAAARRAAVYNRKALALMKSGMKRDVKTLQKIDYYQTQASKWAAREQEMRKRGFKLEIERAKNDQKRAYIAARGATLAKFSAAGGGGVGQESIFGSLGQIWSNRGRNVLGLNQDKRIGLSIFSAQKKQADSITMANRLGTKLSIAQMRDEYALRQLQAKGAEAGVAKPVTGQAGVYRSQAQAQAYSGIGSALSSASAPASRFGDQIFGNQRA